MNPYKIDWEKYAALARETVAEGCVLLKNDRGALPIRKGERVSVFGRIQFDYYKSGTGSGGAVNTRYVTGILDALEAEEDITVDEELKAVYQAWLQEHPFNKGMGWAQEPWCQEEMPLSDEVVDAAAKRSDIAVVVIGRTAGEDKDNSVAEGSYLLTAAEHAMLEAVTKRFDRVAVLLNVGNVIDMNWVVQYDPAAVMYVWQGGQEGGSGVADVLLGRVSPCGKFSDTIVYDVADYPSTAGFGDEKLAVYAEDIYVGYRYFESFMPDRVQYPFGFGLSYTTFTVDCTACGFDGAAASLEISVKNTGSVPGKEVVEVYAAAPQGKLGQPSRALAAFAKTKTLAPGEAQTLSITVDPEKLASYDDGGVTGHKSCWVLEAGEYTLYVGTDVRTAKKAGAFTLPTLTVVEQAHEASAPVMPFDRLHPQVQDGKLVPASEPAPQRTVSMKDRAANAAPACPPYSGDKGWKLGDVVDGKTDLDTFLAQIPDEDLICLMRGEGMNSPKVTPGTGGAFGGVTENLKHFGIPVACCTDGPSGIRMDCGTTAFALPNGTLLACTFNETLNEELFAMQGLELRKNRVDTLLGPGLNIHRSPLNGRNFEYFSEDPLLTGKMAAAQLKGMARHGVTGTIKHFCCNNQEFRRHDVNAVISERALREIYLKAFEIAVKEGGAYCIMSAYNPVNGMQSSSNFDVLTTILREEWGYTGLVMTDWWAKGNDEGGEGERTNVAAQIRAQNDLNMVTNDSATNSQHDNLPEAILDGRVTRAQLVRSAKNTLNVIMRSPVMERSLGRMSAEEKEAAEDTTSADYVDFDLVYQDIDNEKPLDLSKLNTEKGASTMFGVKYTVMGMYKIVMKVSANASEVAQIPMSIFLNGELRGMVMIHGTNGETVTVEQDVGVMFGGSNYLRLYFAQSGMNVEEIRFVNTVDFSKVRPNF